MSKVDVRVTVSPSKSRRKSVPVRFAISAEIAKSLAEQLVVAAKTADNHKQRRAVHTGSVTKGRYLKEAKARSWGHNVVTRTGIASSDLALRPGRVEPE